MMPPMAAPKEKKFETALAELEGVVAKLESEELPLEDALGLFEQGIALSRACTQKLDEADKKVDALLQELAADAAPAEAPDAP